MKFVLVVVLGLAACSVFGDSLFAQSTFNDTLAQARNRVTKTAMLTLGGWAVANITSGFIVGGRTSGTTKYTWQMNAYWNFINLGLAGMGYIRALKESGKSFSLPDNYYAQNSMEKIYLFNLGLDVGYNGAGLYLRERGLNSTNLKTSVQLRGYGTSIIIQGGFLLLMDAAMVLIHHRNTVRVRARMRE